MTARLPDDFIRAQTPFTRFEAAEAVARVGAMEPIPELTPDFAENQPPVPVLIPLPCRGGTIFQTLKPN
jgi:hypothetical protein